MNWTTAEAITILRSTTKSLKAGNRCDLHDADLALAQLCKLPAVSHSATIVSKSVTSYKLARAAATNR